MCDVRCEIWDHFLSQRSSCILHPVESRMLRVRHRRNSTGQVSNPISQIYNLQSKIRNPHSAIFIHQSTIYNLQSEIWNPHSAWLTSCSDNLLVLYWRPKKILTVKSPTTSSKCLKWKMSRGSNPVAYFRSGHRKQGASIHAQRCRQVCR